MSHGVFDWRAFLSEGPLFIGILNLTPDSFSDGGLYAAPEAALAQARVLMTKGFRMLDLGAESTRPGAEPLDAEAEWERLAPVLALLSHELPSMPLSVDTRHAKVAEKALEAGAAVLNDVTGFRDETMLRLAETSGCGLIAMRSRLENGRFLMPSYGGEGEATAERALTELAEVRDRLRAARIAESRIALDPGFGFGTTFKEDCAIWNALPSLDARLCIGLSRKRFTAWKAGLPDLPAPERDGFTAALHREAAAWGAGIFRSHAATLA